MAATSIRELQRLLDEAPFVDALARALAGEDADEVVQNTWLRAVESGAPVRQPRDWLATVVRSVTSNLRRGNARRRAHERAAARAEPLPSSVELLGRQEKRRDLVEAVDALPGPLRTVVLLRYFEEQPPRTIAQHLGVPVTTVKSRLRTAFTLLRRRLDERHGDRKAWLLPLLPAAAPALATGMLAMTAKIKVAATAALVALGAIALWAVDAFPGSPAPAPKGAGQPPPLIAEVSEDRATPPHEVERTETVPPPPAPEPTTGSLVVRATYEEDGAAAADLALVAGLPDADPLFGLRRARTDVRGISRLGDLRPGEWTVLSARNPYAHGKANVVAGAETEIALILPPGVFVTGTVVDGAGLAVAGAAVELGRAAGSSSRAAERVATTGTDGTFALRSCPSYCLIGARAEGYAPSRMHLVYLQDGGSIDLRIELPAAGGTVEGIVLDPQRRPVADALVVVGKGSARFIPATTEGAGPIPAQARTGTDGRFRAVGLAAGEQPVRVRAAGQPPWTGGCTVQVGAVTPVEVILEPGMSCTGAVLDAMGESVAGIEVRAGDWGELSHWRTLSSEDGAFRFDGLPPGEVKVWTVHDNAEAATTVSGGPGETVACELRLVTGLELRGRVLTVDGEPVARASIMGAAQRTGTEPEWKGGASTGADGAFALPNCPEGRRLALQVWAQGFEPEALVDVDPRAGEVVLRVHPRPPATARIRGRILGPDGTPVPQAVLQADERGGDGTGLQAANDAGAFELGPLVPGTWRVCIQVPHQPWMWTEWRALGEGAVWELGTVQLPVPGTIVVRARGPEGLSFHPLVFNGELALGNFAVLDREGDTYRSKPLAPGPHYLMPVGDGVDCSLIPVKVRSGQETVVDMQARTGHRQWIEVSAGIALTELHLRIHRGSELVTGRSSVGHIPGTIRTGLERWLAPGNYTVTARGNGLSGHASFTVREGTNEVVRVVMQ